MGSYITAIDLKKLEEIVERAVENAMARARSEDLKSVAEAIKALADYVGEFVNYQRKFNEDVRRFMDDQRKFNEDVRRFMDDQRKFNEDVRRFMDDQRKFNEDVRRFNRRVERALVEIRDSLGGAYEYYTAHWIELYLAEKGFKVKAHTNVTLPVDGGKEIDVLVADPLVVGEATVAVRSTREAEDEIAKLLDSVDAAEKFYGRRAHMKVLAVENAPADVASYLRKRAAELGIVLVLGREY